MFDKHHVIAYLEEIKNLCTLIQVPQYKETILCFNKYLTYSVDYNAIFIKQILKSLGYLLCILQKTLLNILNTQYMFGHYFND